MSKLRYTAIGTDAAIKVNWGADISTSYLNLAGLTSETTYTYYIKAVKTGMIDSDSQVVSFTTPEAQS